MPIYIIVKGYKYDICFFKYPGLWLQEGNGSLFMPYWKVNVVLTAIMAFLFHS